MYRVVYSKTAAKELEKLDKTAAAMIFGWIDKNLEGCADPRLRGKALAGSKKGLWRYRLGVYRIIADIRDGDVVIEIITVAHRREAYS